MIKKIPASNIDISINLRGGEATFQVYKSSTLIRSQRWRWRLFASNGENLANGGEGYFDKVQAKETGLKVISGGYYSGN